MENKDRKVTVELTMPLPADVPLAEEEALETLRPALESLEGVTVGTVIVHDLP